MTPFFILSCVVILVVSNVRTRDVFHPSFVGTVFLLGTIGGGLLSLAHVDLSASYPRLDFEHDMLFYTAATWAFALGALSAGSPVGVPRAGATPEPDNDALRRAAFLLGAIAWLIYFLQLRAGGGFVEVYSQVKGRGDLGSGIQDFMYLSVPATAFYLMSRRGQPMQVFNWTIVALLVGPLLLPGLLSSRRGPTAMALGAAFFGWYLTRGTRPSLPVLCSAVVAGAVLLLGLVAFRADIYLGSEIIRELTFSGAWRRIVEFVSKPADGHEIIYSSIIITNARLQEDFWWGARYLAANSLWLVPSFVLPDKYSLFGLDGMLYNGGTSGRNFSEAVSAPGAAPMFFGDAFIEFSYFSLLFIFLVGRSLSWLWKRAKRLNEIYPIVYACTLSLLIFLFSQSFQAFSQRLVIVVVASAIAWQYVRHRSLRGSAVCQTVPGPKRRSGTMHLRSPLFRAGQRVFGGSPVPHTGLFRRRGQHIGNRRDVNGG